MALFLDRMNVRRPLVGGVVVTSGSRANASLNAAFVVNTSGPAVAIRYMAPTTDTIDELYIFLDAHGGTIGNITMEATIYNESAVASRCGTTVRDTSTATVIPSADDMWIKFTFGTPYTPTVGEILWLVAYTTNASVATDYPQIMSGTNVLINTVAAIDTMSPYTTTNGFSGAGTGAQELPFVVKQGSNYFGQPFTQYTSTYYTNNQLERGLQFTVDEDVVVSGVIIWNVISGFANVRILADATTPGGTALYDYDLDSDANETTNDICGAKVFDAAVTLTGGTTYKLTLTFSSNTQTPLAMQIEDYTTYSTMFDTLRGYDSMFMPWGAIDDGASGWTIDKAICPGIALIIQSYPAIAGGGGGQRVIGG